MNNTNIKNYQTLAILGTILGIFSPCCIGIIIGGIGIYMSSQVTQQLKNDEIEKAQSTANTVKIMSYIAIALGIIGIIMNIIALQSGLMDEYMNTLNQIQ
ncbi:hypothetical protein UJ101_01269 [Flavobacteriaceae bacterium UJ101]|nr:hypothetical protein UJ101_01269 [Flavobacteriaceae bacterium UJ101]